MPEDGLATRLTRRGRIPTIDPGGFVPAIKRGAIAAVPGVDALEGREVVLEGGRRIVVDAVVAATG